MIVQQNKLYWLKFNALCRYILAHGFSNILPLYIINEYPKSGGSWISNIFSELLGVPFPRNRLPVLKSSILHCHKMQSWNLKNVFIVWRDGRDVLVSLYFHLLYENSHEYCRLCHRYLLHRYLRLVLPFYAPLNCWLSQLVHIKIYTNPAATCGLCVRISYLKI